MYRKIERKEITSVIEDLQKKRSELLEGRRGIPYEKERALHEVYKGAGILQEVLSIEKEFRLKEESLSSSIENIGGRIFALTEFWNECTTRGLQEVEGIDLDKLDWETRMMVLSGDREVIEMLKNSNPI